MWCGVQSPGGTAQGGAAPESELAHRGLVDPAAGASGGWGGGGGAQPQAGGSGAGVAVAPEAGAGKVVDIAPWVEQKAPDGGVYFWNSKTGDSQWEAPTPVQLAAYR